MTLDYFYGQSGELFSYFRIPKALFQDSRFRQLSTDARTLYGILLDRMSLSVKSGWMPMNFDHEELMLMMLYNTGTRLGLMQELRLMQCYLMPDETTLRELSEGVIEKLKLMTDAQFAEVEFPLG